MTAGWENGKLGDLCTIARGGSPRPIREFLTDDPDGVNWIKISDATASNRYIYETTEKITKAGVRRSRMVFPGDLLLSNSMSFGRPYIMRTEGCIHDGWLVLSDKSGEFDQDFLYYYLGSASAYQQFDGLAAGSTVRNLNIELVSRVEVPLPPLEEQKRIVAILDAAFTDIDAAITITKEGLKSAANLSASYVQGMLGRTQSGWETVQLREVCRVDWGNTDLTKKAYVLDGEFLAVSASGGDGRISHREHTAGTPVLSAIGAQCGRMFLPGEDFTAIKNTITLTPIEGRCLGPFLYRVLSNVELPKRGAAQPFIAKGDVQSFEVSVPLSLAEQQEIADRITGIEVESLALSAVLQQKLDESNDLRQSLLQQAFSGQL